MTDKLMYIPNDDLQNYYFFSSKLVVEMFGNSTYCTNLSEIFLNPESCEANK